MRAALYARVSTLDQHPEVQVHALEQYATARGLVVTETYVDRGQSGAKTSRPALDRMLADARRRRFDAIACVKLDRRARSVRNLTTLAGELEALGVDLIVLDQGIDTTTPAGRLVFHVIGSIAEFERDLIRERTRAGLAAARRRGARIGRPRSIVGPETFTLERMLASGRSHREIAAELGVSKASVTRALKRLQVHQDLRAAG